MKRTALPLIAALLAPLLATTPSTGNAQILGTDSAGYPMVVIYVWLQDGQQYKFSTTYTLNSVPGGVFPDSVLSLVDPAGATVAGADGCTISEWGFFSWWPSCFTYTAPVTGNGTTAYRLFLRAYRGWTPGQTTLWKQELPGGSWVALTYGDVTFGGATATTNFAGNGRVFLHTQFQPGDNLYHTIWTTASDEWNILRVSNWNGRVGGSAMIDVPDLTAANLAGTRRQVFGAAWAYNTGPLRLLQNDWFVPGEDYDGDGLGETLEYALATCDSPSTPSPVPSFHCSDLGDCATDPTGARCLAALRDTDRDGLRDDLEVFGYDDHATWPATRSIMELPRWGANPAQMDVFIELDTYDQDTGLAECQGFDHLMSEDTNLNRIGGNDDRDFFADVQSVYDAAPWSLNPNGQPGIKLHFDVGVDNPDPTDTRWGNWGGGNTCLPSSCNYAQAYYNDPAGGCPAGGFDPNRRWVFFHGADREHSYAHVGQASGAGVAYFARDTSHHTHEIGHLGRLSHAGPPGSAAYFSNDFGNYRPNYPSRASYLFQDLGGTTVTDGTLWQAVAFSDGEWATALSGLSASEICPLGAHNLDLLSEVGELVVPSSASWCSGGSDVNWDLVGIFPSGTSYMANYGNRNRHKRWSQIGGYRPMPSGPDATTVGDVLVLAYAKAMTGSGSPTLTLRSDGNFDCNEIPLPLRPAQPSAGEYLTGGSYPGCFRPGTEYQPGYVALGVAIEPANVHHLGLLQPGAVVVWNDGTYLKWATMQVFPTSAPTETSYSFDHKGTLAAFPSTDPGSREPDLIDVPGTPDEMLLVYPGAVLGLMQASLSEGGTSWAAPTQALQVDGSPLPLVSSVSMTEYQGNIYLAGANSSNQYKLYRLAASGSPAASRRWTFVSDLTAAFTAAPGHMRPALATAADLDDPSSRRLWVFYRGTDEYYYSRSNPGGLVFEPASRVLTGQVAAAAPAAVWDARPGLTTPPGLRFYRVLGNARCSTTAECVLWAGASSTCNPASSRCTDSVSGYEYGVTQLAPFWRGPAPGVYTDYNDWSGLQWGFCESLASRAIETPDFTDDYVPTSYRDRTRCGRMPAYPEPIAGGGMAIVSPPGPDDRTLYPELYVEPPEYTCDEL